MEKESQINSTQRHPYRDLPNPAPEDLETELQLAYDQLEVCRQDINSLRAENKKLREENANLHSYIPNTYETREKFRFSHRSTGSFRRSEGFTAPSQPATPKPVLVVRADTYPSASGAGRPKKL